MISEERFRKIIGNWMAHPAFNVDNDSLAIACRTLYSCEKDTEAYDEIETAKKNLYEIYKCFYEYIEQSQIGHMNAEKFGRLFENFMAFGFNKKTGRSFRYTPKASTNQKSYDREEETSAITDTIIELANKEPTKNNLKKLKKYSSILLAHTFLPLVNPVKNTRDYNQAIGDAQCYGFAQLGCIFAEAYGFTVNPVLAAMSNMKCNDEEKSYDGNLMAEYVHYLFSIRTPGISEDVTLVDLQMANAIYRKTLNSYVKNYEKSITEMDSSDEVEVYNMYNEELTNARTCMTYLYVPEKDNTYFTTTNENPLHPNVIAFDGISYPLPKEMSYFFDRKFTHDGYGEPIGDLMSKVFSDPSSSNLIFSAPHCKKEGETPKYIYKIFTDAKPSIAPEADNSTSIPCDLPYCGPLATGLSNAIGGSAIKTLGAA